MNTDADLIALEVHVEERADQAIDTCISRSTS
jgi:hypothetical protein